jgi:hypothetical protein
MIKTFVIDGVGIFLAEAQEEGDHVILSKPLMAVPNQNGQFGLGLHPLFEKRIKVHKNKIAIESELKDNMRDSYTKFWIEKETGIITSTNMTVDQAKSGIIR